MSSVTTWDPVAPALPRPPENALYETVDGRYVGMPPGGTLASIIASRLGGTIGRFAEKHRCGEVIIAGLFEMSPQARRQPRPDVAFVSYRRWPRERPLPRTDAWPVVPDYVIEVVGPSESAEYVQEKVKEYLDAGVLLVWVVYPQLGWVVAYESLHEMRGFTLADDLDAEPVLPGLRLPMRELFSGPAAPPAEGTTIGESEPIT